MEAGVLPSSSVHIPSLALPSSPTTCHVCGEIGASLHYGAMSCVGCKGFFRRALKKADTIDCFAGGACPIRVGDRIACRACRLKKCLEVGMLPSAVRPDRPTPMSAPKSRRKSANSKAMMEENSEQKKLPDQHGDDEWTKRLSVELKTMLMTLLNLETKASPRISKGDTTLDAAKLYPLHVNTIREIVEHPVALSGKRSRIRYEPYRMADNSEFIAIAYRRLIVAIDWVEFLAELIDGGLSADDKVALIHSCFGPLMIFHFAARTAQVTKDENVLCLCNLAYVPRDIGQKYKDTYHLGNGIVGRTLDELVSPYRRYGVLEEEFVCISAIIVLNPLAKDLSDEGREKILSFRHRVQDALYAIIKEARQSRTPSVTYGNLLLSLVPVAQLASCMSENLQFAQTFSSLGSVALLTNLFGCFPIEPFSDTNFKMSDYLGSDDSGIANKEVQTVLTATRKRRLNGANGEGQQSQGRPDSIAPRSDPPSTNQFNLLRPPADFTLTEMFDDIEWIEFTILIISQFSVIRLLIPHLTGQILTKKDTRPITSGTVYGSYLSYTSCDE